MNRSYCRASAMATADSGLKIDAQNAERIGCYVGAGLGGVATIERTYAALTAKGPRHGISPYFVPAIIVNMVPGAVCIKYGTKGPNLWHVEGCMTCDH